jgi:hypothetical protein
MLDAIPEAWHTHEAINRCMLDHILEEGFAAIMLALKQNGFVPPEALR